MGFYATFVHPKLCHLVMRNERLVPHRERIVGAARGKVLEIGIGSGINLPFYHEEVREVAGLEPSPRLLAIARRLAPNSLAPAAFIKAVRN
jgi:hypothetical protein